MSEISEDEWQKMSADERLEHQINNCIFCQIIKGEIPSKKIYDDSNFVGILDKNPGAQGHVLVISKKHVQIMPQLGTELNGELGIVCKKISTKIKKALGVSATSIFVANGAVAGQNAPHFITHIIPRKYDDKVNLTPNLKKINIELINNSRKKIIKHLGLVDLAEEKTKKEEKEPANNDSDDKKIDQINREKTNLTREVKPDEDASSNIDETDKNLLDKISKMFD